MTPSSMPAEKTSLPRSRWRLGRGDLVALMGLARRRWPLFLPVCVVWTFAAVRLFIDPTPRLPLLVNWTPSLPYHVALMRPGVRTPQRGDLIVFAFAGQAQATYPGLRGQPLFKRVRGVPGDVLTVDGRNVHINGVLVGVAKRQTRDRHPLEPIAPQTIPAGHYYVQGTSADSFDSRYRESGLVHAGQVLGVVLPLF